MCTSFLLLVFLGSKARLQVYFFQEALQAVPRPKVVTCSYESLYVCV